MTLQNDLERIAQIPDAERKQAKFDMVIAILQNESGNFAADIIINVLSSFATTMINMGFDPMGVLININKAARDEVRRLLKDQGITPNKH